MIMDEASIRRRFQFVNDPDDIFKSTNAFCVDASGEIIGVNASECSLRDLEGLTGLTKLRYLDVSLNEIADASPLGRFKALEAVDLAFNKVADLAFVEELMELRFLDVRNNRVQTLPPGLSHASIPLLLEYEFQRKGIFLAGNPLAPGVGAALLRGSTAIAEYLKALPADEEAAPIGKSRVAVRGTPLAETAADTVPEPGLGKVRVADRLGAAADAEMLVSVLMARATAPPLAVGLFGEWGSGKSFLMALMYERIEELATLKRSGRVDAEPFCGEVRQVRFNAWHFVDANLWASLAAALFDGLATASKADEGPVLLGDLDRARETAIKARSERETVEKEVEALEARVEGATAVVQSSAGVALRDVRRYRNLRKKLQSATSLAGATDEQTEALVVSLGSVTGLIDRAAMLARLVRDKHVYRRSWATVLALLVIVGGILAGVIVDGMTVAERAGVIVGGIAAVLTPMFSMAISILSLARKARLARERPLLACRERLATARIAEEKTNQAVAQHERNSTPKRQGYAAAGVCKAPGTKLGLFRRVGRDLQGAPGS